MRWPAAPTQLTLSFQRERMVKPTGWVVDMRHYLDEDTGDLVRRLS